MSDIEPQKTTPKGGLMLRSWFRSNRSATTEEKVTADP